MPQCGTQYYFDHLGFCDVHLNSTTRFFFFSFHHHWNAATFAGIEPAGLSSAVQHHDYCATECLHKFISSKTHWRLLHTETLHTVQCASYVQTYLPAAHMTSMEACSNTLQSNSCHIPEITTGSVPIFTEHLPAAHTTSMEASLVL